MMGDHYQSVGIFTWLIIKRLIHGSFGLFFCAYNYCCFLQSATLCPLNCPGDKFNFRNLNLKTYYTTQSGLTVTASPAAAAPAAASVVSFLWPRIKHALNTMYPDRWAGYDLDLGVFAKKGSLSSTPDSLNYTLFCLRRSTSAFPLHFTADIISQIRGQLVRILTGFKHRAEKVTLPSQ